MSMGTDVSGSSKWEARRILRTSRSSRNRIGTLFTLAVILWRDQLKRRNEMKFMEKPPEGFEPTMEMYYADSKTWKGVLSQVWFNELTGEEVLVMIGRKEVK
jgi:hypothetical protein